MTAGRRSGTRRRRSVVLLGLPIVVSMAAWAIPAQSASAAPSKFVYELCDSALPGGGIPASSFTVNPGVAFAPFQNCASPGGAIGIQQTGQTSATFSYMTVAVPETPGGFVEAETISGFGYGWSPGNSFSHIYDNGWPLNNAGETQRIFRIRTSRTPYFGNGGGFNIVMTCDGNASPCGPGGVIAAHYIAATEVDPVAPAISALQGSLLAGGILRGHQDLIAEAKDEGGGLSRIEVTVNGLPAGSPTAANCNLAQVKNGSYEGTVAVTPTPCPSKLKGSWSLDTATYPFHNGANTVQVCASDYSSLTEANETCSAPQTVSVDNSCIESPVPGGEIISAQFARSHKEEVTVPFHKAAKVTGELSNNAGDSISGATICVLAQTQGSRKGLQPVATATTDAHGHFVYKVPPGPNRKLLVGYRHDTFQVARAIRYYAHAKPTLHISPWKISNGAEIRMHGRLPGARAGGRVVVLQASALHSPRWFTFRRATTNHDGVFHSRYRFDATNTTTIYRIRAVVPRQHGYPWEVGHSKPALVEVRG